MSYCEIDLELVVQHRLREVVDAGRPPADPDAWLREARKREALQEHKRRGWIARCARGLRGERELTGWRCVRGTHGMDWVYDPVGTDDPPPASWGWSQAVARAEYDAARKRRTPRRHLHAV